MRCCKLTFLNLWCKQRGYFLHVNNLENRREVGAPYSNHSEKVSTRHDSSLPTEHEPNSSMDLNDNEGTKQRRYFGKDGRAVEDIDYRHSNGDGSHTFPHRHGWDWTIKNGNPRTDL